MGITLPPLFFPMLLVSFKPRGYGLFELRHKQRQILHHDRDRPSGRLVVSAPPSCRRVFRPRSPPRPGMDTGIFEEYGPPRGRLSRRSRCCERVEGSVRYRGADGFKPLTHPIMASLRSLASWSNVSAGFHVSRVCGTSLSEVKHTPNHSRYVSYLRLLRLHAEVPLYNDKKRRIITPGTLVYMRGYHEESARPISLKLQLLCRQSWWRNRWSLPRIEHDEMPPCSGTLTISFPPESGRQTFKVAPSPTPDP